MEVTMNEHEILNISKSEVETFRKALQNTSKKLLVTNTSIHVDDDGTIMVEPTRAIFLLTLGQEYQKLQK